MLEIVSNSVHVHVLRVVADALQLMFCCMPAAERWVQNRRRVSKHKQRVMLAATWQPRLFRAQVQACVPSLCLLSLSCNGILLHCPQTRKRIKPKPCTLHECASNAVRSCSKPTESLSLRPVWLTHRRIKGNQGTSRMLLLLCRASASAHM